MNLSGERCSPNPQALSLPTPPCGTPVIRESGARLLRACASVDAAAGREQPTSSSPLAPRSGERARVRGCREWHQAPRRLRRVGSCRGRILGTRLPPSSPALCAASPARGYGRFISQSAESDDSSVRVQHTRHATFAAHRSPSVRATPPAYAGWHRGTSGTRVGQHCQNLPGSRDRAFKPHSVEGTRPAADSVDPETTLVLP